MGYSEQHGETAAVVDENGVSASAGRPSRPRSVLHTTANLIGVTLTTGVAAAAVIAGVTVLQMRAESIAGPKANPLITVATQQISWSDHYMVRRGFVGRLEAARQTALAFERGGLVLAVKFDEGDRVEQGAIVARLDTAKLKANRLELEASRRELIAQRDLAKLTMGRQNKLQSRGWSPQQRYDEARFSVERFNAAIARVDASIQALDVDIRKSEVKAPFAGKVARRSIDEGAVVAAGTPVLTLLEAGRQQVRVGISPEAARGLKIGETYQLKANGKQLTAKLKALRADLETGSRTVTALFALGTKTMVPLGEVAVLELNRRIDDRGIWLPLSSLVEGRKGLWTVMLADRTDNKPTIRREAVEVLHVADGRAFVRGALREGDRVVTTGTNRITPGQHVVIARLN